MMEMPKKNEKDSKKAENTEAKNTTDVRDEVETVFSADFEENQQGGTEYPVPSAFDEPIYPEDALQIRDRDYSPMHTSDAAVDESMERPLTELDVVQPKDEAEAETEYEKGELEEDDEEGEIVD